MPRRSFSRARAQALRALPLFEGCSNRELRALDRRMAEIAFAPGRALVTQGAGGIECLIISEGRATVSVDDVIVAEVGPGDVVGEMSLLFNVPRTATVTATTPVRAYVLHVGEFFDLLRSVPSVGTRIQRAAVERASVPALTA